MDLTPLSEDLGSYLIRIRGVTSVFHTNPNCCDVRKNPSDYRRTNDKGNLRECRKCLGTYSTKIKHCKPPLPKHGEFPKKILIPVWVCSDGTEFGCEIDALRYELDLKIKKERKLCQQNKPSQL